MDSQFEKEADAIRRMFAYGRVYSGIRNDAQEIRLLAEAMQRAAQRAHDAAFAHARQGVDIIEVEARVINDSRILPAEKP